MFTDTSDFLSTGVNALVAGHEKLHVLFATYNAVAGYKSGTVETGKDGLTIQVQNGNLSYSPLTDLVYCVGTPLHKVGANMEMSLKIEQPDATAFLAVVYAGLSAFNEAVALARKIKDDRPDAKIVITTCDCMLDDKSRTLSPLLQRKEIDAAVVTTICGGHDTMRDILEKVIEVWPAKVAA
jgi:hypothetical protein